MPVMKCTLNSKPGYKWGNQGKCYIYDANNEESEKQAKRKAFKQGLAIGFSDNDDSFFIGCNEIFLSDDDSIKKVQILKVGEYTHPIYGIFKITTEVLKKFKENFDKRIRKVDIPFNYEHKESKAHGSKAAGWFQKIELMNDDKELWVETDWTNSALNSIKEKEYRYTSAEFLPKYKDPESNKVHDWVLIGAALTNTPFIKGMKAIAASECNNKNNERKKTMNKAELISKLAELGIDFHDIEARAKKYDEIMQQVTKLNEDNTTMLNELNESKAKVKTLDSKVKELETKNNEIKFNELVKKGMEEGKLTKALSETKFKEVFDKMGIEFAESFLNEMPKIVDTTSSKGSDMSKDAPKGDAGEQLKELSEKLSVEKKISFSEAFDIVYRENPELVKEYEKLGKE